MSVECCAIVDAVLSGESYVAPAAIPLTQLRFAVPSNFVFDGIEAPVSEAFDRAIAAIEASGAIVEHIEIPEFSELPYINRLGGFVCAEAWGHHRELIEDLYDQYDPRVASRIKRGQEQNVADYLELQRTRETWVYAVESQLAAYDAVLMPTVPVVAPTIDELSASDDSYFAANGLILRNATLINFLNGCALSLPCHHEGEPPSA